MAVSRLFRDMIFVRAGRSHLNGVFKDMHISVKNCDILEPIINAKPPHIYIRRFPFCFGYTNKQRHTPKRTFQPATYLMQLGICFHWGDCWDTEQNRNSQIHIYTYVYIYVYMYAQISLDLYLYVYMCVQVVRLARKHQTPILPNTFLKQCSFLDSIS